MMNPQRSSCPEELPVTLKSLATMKRFRSTFFVYVFLASVGYAPSAQRDQGTTSVTGRVSAAVQLSVRKEWQPSNQPAADLHLAADSTGVNSVQIILSGSEQTESSEVVVPLEMRTNEAYELRLTLISSEGPAPAMLASIGSLRPSGALVSPRATEVVRDENSIELARCLSPVTALRGTRVSLRGNFTTPTNALLADLNLTISPRAATQGSWRAVFRVSLHRSA
jgi:hypothetical protein